MKSGSWGEGAIDFEIGSSVQRSANAGMFPVQDVEERR
jgi:hypothetical protein